MIRKVLAVLVALAVVGVISGLVARNRALVEELDDAYEVVRLLEDMVDELRAEKGELETRLSDLSTVYAPVYFLAQSDEGYEVVPELRLIDTDSEPAAVISALLTQMVDGPTRQSVLFPVFPLGTRLLGVEVIDGVAYVDFSGEILDQSVGSPVESAVVEAIARTVIEVGGVRAVQILVGGETIPSLAGHVDLSRPISLVPLDDEL